jgi:uncharacterized membrane protein YagU involved in acid resistance
MRKKRRNRIVSTVAGAVGGIAAAFVMNRFQQVWSDTEKALNPEERNEAAPSGDDATVKTANGFSHAVFHHDLTGPEKKWAGPAVHYIFGGVMGAAYGALAPATPIASFGGGAAYGSALWLFADEIGVPAAGLSGPPSDTPIQGHVKAWASHLVYGLVADLTRRAIVKAAEAV